MLSPASLSRSAFVPACCAAVLVHAPAFAQRTQENAVTQSTDAFGRSVGNERTGLYSAEDVRGFNPVDAGNARVEGLYFDQIASLSMRLTDGSTVRVGISAQGYPFPAPTGLVDYALTKPGGPLEGNFDIDVNQFGGSGGALEFKIPLAGDRLGISGGFGGRYLQRPEGGTSSFKNAGATLAWRPSQGAEILLFGGGFVSRGEEARPTLFPAGNALPPRIKRREFYGQDWAERSSDVIGYGTVAKLPFGAWRFESGLFVSQRDTQSAFADIVTGVTPQGTAAARTIIADRDNFDRSLSGEARLIREIRTDQLLHKITASIRGRKRDRLYGGTLALPLAGPNFADRPDPRPEPSYVLGAENSDKVRQITFGAAYGLSWAGRGSLDLGLSKSSYRKTVDFAAPALPTIVTRDKPLLWNIGASIIATRRLAFYGGLVRGQEEALIAPDRATNRSEAPPAIRTQQFDAGLRYAITPTLSLVAGVFSVKKPYFNLDAALRYRQLGEINNRGLEFSIAGRVNPSLSVVVGTVLLDPVISGEAVDTGQIRERPVGQAKRRSTLNLDWRSKGGKGPFSLDFALESFSSRTANALNTLSAPPRETINLGARYRFDLFGKRALLRPQVQNLFNDYGWQISPSGGFTYTQDRTASIQFLIDF